jgi:hypothetical protein
MDPVYAPQISQQYTNINDPECYRNSGPLGYHAIFVTIFLAICFYLVFFRFSALTPAHPTPEKVFRNKVYRVCGLVMLAAFIVIGYLAIFKQGASIFWPESLACAAFAFAWLVKGQLIFGDPAEATRGLRPA